MGALLDLWKSERGLVAVALIAAATVMSSLGIITVDQWLDYTKWLFVTYAAAKTVTGAVATATAQPKGASAGPGVWQQVEALLARAMASATAPVPPSPPMPAATTAPVSIVPPPKAG